MSLSLRCFWLRPSAVKSETVHCFNLEPLTEWVWVALRNWMGFEWLWMGEAVGEIPSLSCNATERGTGQDKEENELTLGEEWEESAVKEMFTLGMRSWSALGVRGLLGRPILTFSLAYSYPMEVRSRWQQGTYWPFGAVTFNYTDLFQSSAISRGILLLEPLELQCSGDSRMKLVIWNGRIQAYGDFISGWLCKNWNKGWNRYMTHQDWISYYTKLTQNVNFVGTNFQLWDLF